MNINKRNEGKKKVEEREEKRRREREIVRDSSQKRGFACFLWDNEM